MRGFRPRHRVRGICAGSLHLDGFRCALRSGGCVRGRVRRRGSGLYSVFINLGVGEGAGRGNALPDKPACSEACYSEIIDAAEAHVGEVFVDERDVVCAVEFLVDVLAKRVCGRAQRTGGAL